MKGSSTGISRGRLASEALPHSHYGTRPRELDHTHFSFNFKYTIWLKSCAMDPKERKVTLGLETRTLFLSSTQCLPGTFKGHVINEAFSQNQTYASHADGKQRLVHQRHFPQESMRSKCSPVSKTQSTGYSATGSHSTFLKQCSRLSGGHRDPGIGYYMEIKLKDWTVLKDKQGRGCSGSPTQSNGYWKINTIGLETLGDVLWPLRQMGSPMGSTTVSTAFTILRGVIMLLPPPSYTAAVTGNFHLVLCTKIPQLPYRVSETD